ncbi:hypothetical protein P3T76_005361 [Phytophthora citrophthora]|uniref:Uncharacterized protein n=1 Tax=Phytophthora citrophthora TaxID=4793 RepID=A0AAD9GSX5_9STRA|nr:hypothetical protein P3T76_005361 [Phytophthora citrophthora]
MYSSAKSIIMSSYSDFIPTSTSLLLLCTYRSKVCTNLRAVKVDGTLHNLCEAHRRKANDTQQRLHKRRRDERARRRRAEAIAKTLSTKTDPSPLIPIDLSKIEPIAYNNSPRSTRIGELSQIDMEILNVLLFDTQQQSAQASGVVLSDAEVNCSTVVEL